MAEPAVDLGLRDGQPTLRLHAAGAAFELVPGLSGLGVALTYQGAARLDLHGGLDGFVAGHTMGLPLLHPWANRLGSDTFAIAERSVDLSCSRLVRRDEAGLPIHGTLVGSRTMELDGVRVDAHRGSASASLRLAYDTDELLECFPFPHDVHVLHELGPGSGGVGAALAVTTTVVPTGDVSVPISFGWHPYFRMPDADRSDWVLELPEREAVELDRSMLPTVGRRAEPAEAAVLGDRTFDHAYALGGDRVLGLSVGDHTTRVVFGHGYPFAQVYVPGSFDAVALEPMTAPIDALRTGEHPQVTPGGAFSATFRVELS